MRRDRVSPLCDRDIYCSARRSGLALGAGVKRRGTRTVCGVLSLIGFTFASLSCLLAVSSMLYANVTGGFAYYDPVLMRIYRCGFLLSLAGFGFGVSGIWQSNPLRWHAPACAVGMLIYWFGAAMAE